MGAFIGIEKAKEALDDILATGDKFENFGIQFSNAFGGAKQGQEALSKVKELAEGLPLSLDDVAKAALQAKKVGLDPFNGTLETLVDANAKYGGSTETLGALIDTFGKATAKGSISVKQLTTLQEQGVPASKLLGAALNKTSDQILDLAEKGELGRDSIALLLQQLGASSAGDASKSLGLLGTLVTKVKDQYDEFLELIAKSGVYDYVRDKLSAINVALKQGIGDGSLKEKAQAISDAIVNIGNAALGATRFVYDHGSAILEAARAYVVFRTAMFTLDVAGVAAKFAGLTKSVAATTAATEVAAAEGGVFSRLAGKINAIPKAIQIAIATAGVDFALSQLEKIVTTIQDWDTLNKKVDADYQERFTLQDKLYAKAQVVAEQLKGFANEQIASASELETKSKAQSDAYLLQLQNAIKYFTALKIIAEATSDAKGAQDATARLRELVVAVQEVTEHESRLKDSLTSTSEAVNDVTNRYDDLKAHGASAATAIAGAFDKIQINQPQGLKDTLDLIQQISLRSIEGKQAVQNELSPALAKLNATDLRAFEDNVSQRLKLGQGNAEALTLALRAGLTTELQRLGLTAEQAGVQFTAGGTKIIDTFADIARNSQASGEQIQLAFAKALSQTQTEGEVDALKKALQDAFNSGKLSADQFAVAMAAAGRKTADIEASAAEAGAALDGVGKVGQTAADRISASLQDARDKIVAQASDISTALAAALQAGSDPAKIADLKAQFAAVDATLQELNAKIAAQQQGLQKTGTAGAQAGQQIADGANQAADAVGQVEKRVEDTTGKIPSFAQQLTSAMESARGEFVATSDAAAKFFDTVLDGELQAQGIMRQTGTAVQTTGQYLAALREEAAEDVVGISKYYYALAVAQDATNKKIAEERDQLKLAVAGYQNLGEAGGDALTALGGKGLSTLANLEKMDAELKAGTYDAGLLGQQELQPLQEAIEGAIERTQALADAVKAANQQFADLAASTQDALDQESGNNEAIEDRRHAKELADLQAAAKAAGQLNSQTYQQAVANENALHALKIKNIEAQAAAQQTADAGGSPSQVAAAGNSDASGSGAGALPANTGNFKAPAAQTLAPIHIHLPNGQTANFLGTPADADALTKALISNLSRGKQLASGFVPGKR